jgi:hypothetical protein
MLDRRQTFAALGGADMAKAGVKKIQSSDIAV